MGISILSACLEDIAVSIRPHHRLNHVRGDDQAVVCAIGCGRCLGDFRAHIALRDWPRLPLVGGKDRSVATSRGLPIAQGAGGKRSSGRVACWAPGFPTIALLHFDRSQRQPAGMLAGKVWAHQYDGGLGYKM
ncbi:hypothetical protein [Candidatus Methylacidithermus pantelleriae]|uniref:hypothetical protein n=1 Tax=Candidatus Methylacidithermus pantelleriae TaxID=2744239 RepID=UPI00157D9179|nr:hypothetical protein [Candidatus Methylacidithermus pantelleriae]